MLFILSFQGHEISCEQDLFMSLIDTFSYKFQIARIKGDDDFWYYYFWDKSFDFVYFGCTNVDLKED